MKVIKRQIERPQDEGITISYIEWTNQLGDIENYILSSGKHITGYGGNKETLRINIKDILYFEAVGELVFAYTSSKVYEIKMRLYQVEEILRPYKMKRASKSVLINLRKIESVRPALNGRLYAKMLNGEEVLISRQYAKEIAAEIMSA